MIVALLAAAACHTHGVPPFTVPDRACTPGAPVLPRARACTPTDRGSTPAAVRRAVLSEYGVPGWTGKDGEIDHLVPWFLTHDSSENNLWPQRGYAQKDRLEDYVYRRICVKHTMRPQTAAAMFRSDWRVWYRRYKVRL